MGPSLRERARTVGSPQQSAPYAVGAAARPLTTALLGDALVRRPALGRASREGFVNEGFVNEGFVNEETPLSRAQHVGTDERLRCVDAFGHVAALDAHVCACGAARVDASDDDDRHECTRGDGSGALVAAVAAELPCMQVLTTAPPSLFSPQVMAAELAAFAAELHRAARQAAHERRQLELKSRQLELRSRQLELTRVEALHAGGAGGARGARVRAVLSAEDVGQLLEAGASLAPNTAPSPGPPNREPVGAVLGAGWLTVEEMQKTVNAIAEDILYQERFDSVALPREAIDESLSEGLHEVHLTPTRRRDGRRSRRPSLEFPGAHHGAPEGLADDGVAEGVAEVKGLLLNLSASECL